MSASTPVGAPGPRPLLTAQALRFAYGDSTALTGVDLELAAGEAVVLVGRNGAGKSTLMRCLARWVHPSAGSIRLVGGAAGERDARRRVVLVPDTPPFWEDLTAWEHLAFVARAHRLREWQPRARALLRRFDLADHGDALTTGFSRGMCQKLALTMALLVEPPVLLLDEPFGPLDPESARVLWQVLDAYRIEGHGVLIASHQTPPGRPDRYLVLHAGRIVAGGPPDELALALGARSSAAEDLLRAALGHDG